MTKTRMTKAQKLALAAGPEAQPEVAGPEAQPEVAGPEVQPEAVDLGVAMRFMVTYKVHKVVKTVKTGVGEQILQHIADGVLSNKEIVAQVLADNPLRKTTYACVAWYKSQVKAGKIDLPKPIEEVAV